MTKVEKVEKNTNHKKEKEKSARRGQNKPPTKIIIRHLPPTMLESDFLQQIDPMPEHDDYYFVEADWSLGYDATCRAYITFKNYEDVFLFRDRFDGYVFVDTKGAEYPAIVEFAPFQGFMDHKSRRKDLNCNTIEQDEHYQQFIKNLEAEREAAAKGGDNKIEFSLDRKKEDKITTTPLLEYLADKREKRREDKKRQREEELEKRRQKDAQQVTKIISNKSNKSKKDSKSNDSDQQQKRQQNQQEQDSVKKASKRARDQKRREEYYARKMERERDRQDVQTKRDSVSSKTSIEQLVESSSSATGQQTSDNNRDGGGGRRYSEKRDRHRNRKDKQKSRDDGGKRNNERKDDEQKQAVKKADLSDPVKTFFDNFNEPNSQQAAQTQNQTTKNSARKASDTDMHEVQRQLDKLDMQDKSETTTKDEQCGGKSKDAEKKETERERNRELKRHELQSQRSAEERRIRNKDRPSIAIYQPKPRLRLSEESNGRETGCSQPTSDCESLRKEEHQQQPRTKKVSRYSDRRAEMHAERRADRAAGAGSGSAKRGSRGDKTKTVNDASDDNPIERTCEVDVSTVAKVETQEAAAGGDN